MLAGAWGAASQAWADERLEQVRSAIARERLKWTAGQTALSRLSPQERPGGIGGADRALPRDFGAAARPLRVSPRPSASALDWRDLHGYSFLPPVRDQGACGSCWAFAMVGALEALVAQRTSWPGPAIDLSEQHLLDCAASSLGCDSGGLTWGPPGAFLTREGVTEERCYPYLSGASGARGSCAAAGISAECRAGVVGAEKLVELVETMPAFPQWDPPDFQLSDGAASRIKSLLETRPVGVTMRVFDDLYYYRGGVYAPTPGAQRLGLHAVVLVGYDDPGGWWIVRNSWGEDWGEAGYLRIRYGTSSIGMYAFAFEYEEAQAAPAFCALPQLLVLDGDDPGTAAELRIANCGGGVLSWQASFDADWVGLQTAGGTPVESGHEVAAGTRYRVGLSGPLGPQASAVLTLTGTDASPVRVALAAGAPNRPGETAQAGLPEQEAASSGCGCAATGTPAGLLGAALLGAGALRPRRERARRLHRQRSRGAPQCART